mmetsp:Transcript_15967/g.36838  ORF Transcript_15967/g.36838 Transcript_15967/m.36838 type:complete len:513 (-) Transcript_15967:152-1690(-)
MDSLNRQQQKRRRQLPAPACTPTKHHAVLLLLILVVLPAIWVPVSSLRTPTSIGSPRGTTATSLGGARVVAIIPRGGSDSGKKPDAKKSSGKKSEDSIDDEADEEDETEVETEASDEEEMKEEVAEMVEVVEAEVEEIVEVVDGELAEEEVEDAVDVQVRSEAEEEETIEEVDAEVSDAIETKEEEEEEGGDEEEEEEEEDGVVYPTDEIPSDDVRAFHTTDGELADDEGMYTDGQNESPITVDDSEEDEEEPEIQTSTEVEDAMSVPAPAPFIKSVIPTAATSDAADDDEEDAAVPVLTVIDEETKRVLISELRYTKADVSQMRSEVAGEVVRNRLMRPTEGMPPSFYIDPSQIPKKKVLSRKNIVLSVVGVAILSFGATTLKDQENDLGKTVEDFVEALKDIREKIMALIVFAKSTRTKVETKADDARKKIEAIEAKVEAVKSAVSEALDEDDEEESEEAVADDGDEAVHSIRPGTKAEEIPDPDADKTWLDKALTGVERSIKKFLSIEI